MFTIRRSARLAVATAAGLVLLALAGCSSGSDPVAEEPAETDTTPVPTSTIVAAESPVTFTEMAEEAGLSHAQSEGAIPPDCLFSTDRERTAIEALDEIPEVTFAACAAERMAGGVAVGDYDGDGDPDLFFSTIGNGDRLYRNDGGVRFVDVSSDAGLPDDGPNSNGAAFADIDNDGDQDLVVSTIAEDGFVLYVNDGSGNFVDESVDRGVRVGDDTDRRGFSVAVGDYDRDGYVDLHFTEWRSPTDFLTDDVIHSRLLRNLGATRPGYFEDVTDSAGVALGDPNVVQSAISTLEVPPDSGGLATASFASTFVDLDGDGWQDLAVASDFGTSQLFWNNGDGTFEEGTAAAGVGLEGNAMGSTFGDYDNDGDLDWFVTAILDPGVLEGLDPSVETYTGNRLYRNEGDRTFVDVTDSAGVVDGFWGWGAAFFDMDNDGLLDLAMTNGQDFGVEGTMGSAGFELSPNRLWWNQSDGTFAEVSDSAGFASLGGGKGLAVVDVDGDGDLDVVQANNVGAPELFVSGGAPDENRWLRVSAVGTTSNRDAIGAVVEVEASDGAVYRREIGVGSHFLGQSERVAHFGLGPSDELVDVVITWPASGRVQRIDGVTPDQVLEVVEPDG